MQPTLNIQSTPATSNKENQIYRVIRSYETITFQFIKGGAGLQKCDYGNLFPCSKYETDLQISLQSICHNVGSMVHSAMCYI